MKKILFLWPQISNDGGGEFALVRLIENLCRYYDIDVLCYENIYKQKLPSGVNVCFVSEPSHDKFGKLKNKIRLLYKVLQVSKNYDLVILNDVPFMNLIIWVTSIINKTKYIVWAHSCRSEMLPAQNRLIDWLYRKTILHAKKVVCVSKYAANSMQLYLLPQVLNPYVIYNVLKQKLKVDKEFTLKKNVINICGVGRLTQEKNFNLLIDALNLIQNKIKKPFHLYICGDGVEREILERKISIYELANNVTLVGHTIDVMSYISQCDILVSPSSSESFSLVVYEALLCNCAVIVTKTGASEIVEDGKYGVVVDKNDVNQLSNALIKLINDDELRVKYQMNAHLALDKFNTLEVIRQWRQIIDQVIQDVE